MIAFDLGKVIYDEGLFYQQKMHKERVNGSIDDVILLMEHNPVITIGKSGGEEDLLIPEEKISAGGVSVRRVNRGGKITCHFPGQLVVYPVINLNDYGHDIHGFVNNLEEVIIRTLADFGIKGERIPDLRGVFVDNNKIAAIGIEIRNSVTMHGFSFNIMEDWSLYSLFVPCGITNKGITFLESCLDAGTAIDMSAVKERILFHLSGVFRKDISKGELQKEYKLAKPFEVICTEMNLLAGLV
ncbi:MAG: lipoyl(octanoyl) transferase LipB [Syntrophobacterales bacterium]|nr:MAG: lipoyl(octanoyl) transferase LipB [Syntrophobacterales bacterium]